MSFAVMLKFQETFEQMDYDFNEIKTWNNDIDTLR